MSTHQRLGPTFLAVSKRLSPPRRSAGPFARLLAAYIARNANARGEYGESDGPGSAPQFAAVITGLAGREVKPGAVLSWAAGRTLPNARYIPAIEDLLGLRWRDMLNPSTVLPTPDEVETFRLWNARTIEEQRSALRSLAHEPA